MTKHFTSQDISQIVGKSPSAILRRKDINKYLVSESLINSTGRPAKIFKPSVLELWGLDAEDFAPTIEESSTSNSRRADYGVPRGMDPATWHAAVKEAKECFLSMPTKNLLEACRMTESVAQLNGAPINGDYLYRRLTRRRSRTNAYTSPYYSENWDKVHDEVYKVRKSRFYNHPFLSYNMFGMFRSAGLMGKGYGSRRVIVVDDFKRDVWVEDEGEMKMPWGLVFIDGITNYPLMIIPAESITTDIVAAGILMTCFAHGIHSDTIWVFETARAMKNKNIIGLIESLYTPEQLEAFKVKDHWSRLLFDGQHGPYINSPSQIAQSVFKSKVERSIRNFKDEFDGVYFPTQYQGGDRKEGVQLTLAGSPLDIIREEKPGQDNAVQFSKRLIPIAGFWERLYNWIWGKYIHVPRTNRNGMFKHFVTTFDYDGFPSIKDVHDYFTSDNDGSFKPDMSNMHRFAMLLFYAQPNRHNFTVKVNRIGSYQTTIENRQLNLICNSLNESHVGIRVCTIPIPDNNDHFIVVDVTRPDEPLFIGIAEDFTANTFEEAKRYRHEIRQRRESDIKRMRDDAESHYKELGDDFNYTPTVPNMDGSEWTVELAGKQSKLLRSNEHTTDELTEIDSADDVSEYKFESKAMKDFFKQFNKEL